MHCSHFAAFAYCINWITRWRYKDVSILVLHVLEKMRLEMVVETQTKLPHYFFMSNNKSNLNPNKNPEWSSHDFFQTACLKGCMHLFEHPKRYIHLVTWHHWHDAFKGDSQQGRQPTKSSNDLCRRIQGMPLMIQGWQPTWQSMLGWEHSWISHSWRSFVDVPCHVSISQVTDMNESPCEFEHQWGRRLGGRRVSGDRETGGQGGGWGVEGREGKRKEIKGVAHKYLFWSQN